MRNKLLYLISTLCFVLSQPHSSAQKYIYIPAFIITHDDFANSLINAKKRGVDVKIIIDATNIYAKKSKVKTLRNSNISVKVENYAGKVHSKSIIIDDKYNIFISI